MGFDVWDSKNVFSLQVILLILSAALVYFFRLFGNHMSLFGSIITTVSGLIAVIAGIYAIRHMGLKSLHGKSLLMLTSANLLWMVADLSWITVNGLAVVSFSDILWLIGYPLFFFGILFGIQAFVGNIFKSKIRVVVAAVLILAFGILYFSVFHLEWNASKTDVENLVSVGYVLGDMFLIMPLIMLMCISVGEIFSFSWLIIGISMLLTLVDDMAYNFNPDGYVSGSPIDLVRFSAYLLMALAFIFMKRETVNGQTAKEITGTANAVSEYANPSASVSPVTPSVSGTARQVHAKSPAKKRHVAGKTGKSRK